MATFAERLKARRNKLGLTQKSLALSAGVSETSITNWERGVNPPTMTSAAPIAKALGVSVNWLFGGPHEIEPAVVIMGQHDPLHESPEPFGADLGAACRSYLDAYLALCGSDRSRLELTLRKLQSQFPLSKWPASHSEPSGDAGLSDAEIRETTLRGQAAQGTETAMKALGLKQKAASSTGKTSVPADPVQKG